MSEGPVRLGDGPPPDSFDDLVARATAEGYRHLDRLAAEWAAGEYRMGSALFGAFADGALIAVGALTPDPYDSAPDLARLRRLYVHPDHRCGGLGRRLADALVAAARPPVRRLSLRAADARAARFWESLGFRPDDGPDRTHLRAL